MILNSPCNILDEEERFAEKPFFVKKWGGGPVLSLNEKARLSAGPVSSLYNGSNSRRVKVSIVCLENIELSKSASERFQRTPSLSARVSVYPHTSVYSYLSLLSLFLVTVQLCLLCFLRDVSLPPALFHWCLPDSSSAPPPPPDPNTSVLLNKCPEIPYEVTLPGSVSSPGMPQLA